ncbi:MAG: WD40 repeat domain-containing protein [Phycisphaerae bacterium]
MPGKSTRAIKLTMAIVLMTASAAGAHGLITAAADSDGSVVATGGYNRAVFVLETSDWTVTQRIWIGAWVRHIAFSNDGSRCLVLDDAQRLHVFDTSDWDKLKTIENVSALAVASDADVAVTAGGPDDESGISIHVWNLPECTVSEKILPPEGSQRKLSQVAVSADGATAFARTVAFESDEETDTVFADSYEGFARQQISKLRSDGKVSAIMTFDLDAGSVVDEVVCFDHPTIAQLRKDRMFVVDGRVITAAYAGYLGILDPSEGTYRPIAHNRLSYGSGLSGRGEVYVGSLRDFMVLAPNGQELLEEPARIPELPGWAEYLCWFAPLGQDRVLAVTTAYRLVVIDRKSRDVLNVVHCY